MMNDVGFKAIKVIPVANILLGFYLLCGIYSFLIP
jgi:hypothetical protein